MRSVVIGLVAIAVSLGTASVACAQGYALVIMERPFHAQNPAGIVVDTTGASVEGVVVKDCDATFKHVLSLIRTDKDGSFAFPKAKTGSTHFLRLSKSGFDPMQVTMVIRRIAESRVRIQLHIATYRTILSLSCFGILVSSR